MHEKCNGGWRRRRLGERAGGGWGKRDWLRWRAAAGSDAWARWRRPGGAVHGVKMELEPGAERRVVHGCGRGRGRGGEMSTKHEHGGSHLRGPWMMKLG